MSVRTAASACSRLGLANCGFAGPGGFNDATSSIGIPGGGAALVPGLDFGFPRSYIVCTGNALVYPIGRHSR